VIPCRLWALLGFAARPSSMIYGSKRGLSAKTLFLSYPSGTTFPPGTQSFDTRAMINGSFSRESCDKIVNWYVGDLMSPGAHFEVGEVVRFYERVQSWIARSTVLV
jgi:hypothetical protein